MAWSDMTDLEKKYQGLQNTFQKLKKREKLCQEDITPLQLFVDATVTCTTNVEEIKKLLRPNIQADGDEEHDCIQKCDPEDCANCCQRCGELV